MGWGSGSDLMFDVINIVEKHVENKETKINMFKELIKSFANHDADSLDECCDYSLAYRLAWQDLKNST